MLELAIWMYHIGNPDPVVRAITDVATGLVILWGVLYGIFSTLIWGVCWIFKINYDPDLVAVAWAVPVLLDTLVNKAYDWNNEVRDWD